VSESLSPQSLPAAVRVLQKRTTGGKEEPCPFDKTHSRLPPRNAFLL
jgi:hypothetical protein